MKFKRELARLYRSKIGLNRNKIGVKWLKLKRMKFKSLLLKEPTSNNRIKEIQAQERNSIHRSDNRRKINRKVKMNRVKVTNS